MSFILWNTETGEPHGRERPERYTVFGQPGPLEAPLIELEIIEEPYPALGLNERAVRTITPDIAAKTLTRTWVVEAYEPSAEELEQREMQAEADSFRTRYSALRAGTTTAQQQRDILAFLLKCEAVRRGLIAT
jgi:hypothetical protein